MRLDSGNTHHFKWFKQHGFSYRRINAYKCFRRASRATPKLRILRSTPRTPQNLYSSEGTTSDTSEP